MPTVLLTERGDHFYMAWDEEWMEILKQIDLYTNHEHLEYLETFIHQVIVLRRRVDMLDMDDETMDTRLFVLKKLYEKRRQLRQSIETDIGRIFPPYETEFSLQFIYDICCYGDMFDPEEPRERDLTEIKLNYNEICLPVLDFILQEHRKMFPSITSNIHGCAGFETSKREFICEMLWNRYKFNRFRPGPPTWIPEEDYLRSIEFADDFMDNFVKENCDLLKKTEMIMMHQKTESLPLLHYAVKHGYPFIIVWFISKLYPDQIRQRDSQGCIPLHYSFREYVLLEHRCLPMTFYRWNGIDSDVLYDGSGIDYPEIGPDVLFEYSPYEGGIDDSEYAVPCYLIHTFPDGASFANLQGKLPLHMSLEVARHLIGARGKDGCIGARRDDCKDVGYLERRRSFMNRLIKIAPKALATRDAVTRLFPFMIPSMQPGERNGGEEAREGNGSDDSDENGSIYLDDSDSDDSDENGSNGLDDSDSDDADENGNNDSEDSDDADANEIENNDSLLLTCTYHILKQNPAVLKNFIHPDSTDMSQNIHEKKRAKLA